MDLLRGRYRVIAAELLASAPDSGALGAFTFAQDCDFIGQLVDMNPGAHLLGHSYGGVVSIEAALGHRGGLSSLVLIEPSCFHLLEQEKQPEYAEIASLQVVQRAHEARGDTMGAAQAFLEYWIGPDAWASMPPRRKDLMARGVPKLNEDWPGTLDHNTRLSDYPSLTMPVLLMRAKDTRSPSFRIVDLLRPVLPDAALVEIESGGHMSPLTNPEPVNAAIAQFLDAQAHGLKAR